MQVTIAPRARQDLDDIFFFLARDSSVAVAARFRDAFEETSALLAETPRIGNPYPFTHRELADIRRFFVKDFSRYLVFYRVEGARLDIIRVIDASRDIQKLFRRQRS